MAKQQPKTECVKFRVSKRKLKKFDDCVASFGGTRAFFLRLYMEEFTKKREAQLLRRESIREAMGLE
jgi:hypothetical protein